MLNSNGFGEDVGSEVVKADGEVFGAGAIAMVGGDFDAAFVVFENSTVNFGGSEVEVEASGLEFLEELHNADNVA